jgi:hypothetical protein
MGGGGESKEAGIKYFLQKRDEIKLIRFGMPGREEGVTSLRFVYDSRRV